MARSARVLLLTLIQLVLVFAVVPVASATDDGQAWAGSAECDRPDSCTAETDVHPRQVHGEGLGAGEATALVYDGVGWIAPQSGLVSAVAARGSLTRETDRPNAGRASIDRSRLRPLHDSSAPRTTPGASNAADFARLTRQLEFDEAASVFNRSGGLQPSVINNSTPIIRGPQLGNQQVVKALTADGSNIADWAKYTTQSFQSPSGPFQVHFYRNSATGAVNYAYDYKVVFTGR